MPAAYNLQRYPSPVADPSVSVTTMVVVDPPLMLPPVPMERLYPATFNRPSVRVRTLFTVSLLPSDTPALSALLLLIVRLWKVVLVVPPIACAPPPSRVTARIWLLLMPVNVPPLFVKLPPHTDCWSRSRSAGWCPGVEGHVAGDIQLPKPLLFRFPK